MKPRIETPPVAAGPLPDGGHWLTPDETRRAVNIHRRLVRDPSRFLKHGVRLVIDEDVRLVTRTTAGDFAIVVIEYPSSFTPARIVEDRLEWAEPPEGITASAYEFWAQRLYTHH